MPEMYIEVDKEDNVIGGADGRAFYRTGRIHRASHTILFNSKGEVLIQKRSANKRSYPGLWDTSVAGTLAIGETYESNAVKELEEEIGIKAPVRRLFHCHVFDEVDSSHKEVYAAHSDDPITIEPMEVSEVKWVSLPDLKLWLERSPEEFTPTMPPIMNIYFEKFGLEQVPWDQSQPVST